MSKFHLHYILNPETHLKINAAKCLQPTDGSSLPVPMDNCLCVKGINHSITPSVVLPALLEPSRIYSFKLTPKRTSKITLGWSLRTRSYPEHWILPVTSLARQLKAKETVTPLGRDHKIFTLERLTCTCLERCFYSGQKLLATVKALSFIELSICNSSKGKFKHLLWSLVNAEVSVFFPVFWNYTENTTVGMLSNIRNARNGKQQTTMMSRTTKAPTSLLVGRGESKGPLRYDCGKHPGSNFVCDIRESKIVWINT